MKKTIFIFLIVFLPALIFAQPYTNKEKALITARVDSLVQKYMQKSSLAEIGSSKQSLKVIREFKTLFTPNAIIFDDMNAEFVDDGNGYPYKLSNKSVAEFFDGLIEQFSQGIIVNNRNININYNDIDKGEITVALERSISGVKSTGKYSLVNEDTLSIKIAVQPDKSVKISGITAIGSNIRVINDKDLDGVVDLMDRCPDTKGIIKLEGCPDSDGDGIANRDDECPDQAGSMSNRGCPASTFAYSYVFSASTGIMYNLNRLETPLIEDLTYDNPNYSESGVNLKNPGFSFGFNVINAQLAFYFGKKKFKKNMGISIGVAFTPWNARYDASGSAYFFRDVNNNQEYSKLVSLTNAVEENSFTMLNFPLMLRYKAKLGSKLAIEGSFGPSFILFTSKVRGEFSGKGDFEAILTQNDNGEYDDYTSNYVEDKTDLILKDEEINANLFMESSGYSNQNANVLFNELNAKEGFDLGVEREIRRSNSTGTRSGLAINAGLDLFYHIMPTIAVKIGSTFTITPNIKNSNVNYEPIKGSNNDYFSVFGSKAKSNYTSFGFNIGLIFGI